MKRNPDSPSDIQPYGGETPSTSSSLIARATRREEEAWNRLAALYGPLVYAWCRRMGLRAEDSADTVHDVFLVVIDAIAGFHGGRRGAFRAWLRAITRNKVYDRFRLAAGQASAPGGSSAQERLLQLEADISAAEQSSTLQPKDLEDDVWQCAVERVRSQFRPHIWEAFWKVAVDEVPAAEVAAELDMSLANVYQAKSRVLRRLRQELGDLEAE